MAQRNHVRRHFKESRLTPWDDEHHAQHLQPCVAGGYPGRNEGVERCDGEFDFGEPKKAIRSAAKGLSVNPKDLNGWKYGGDDGVRTRDLRRDRPAF